MSATFVGQLALLCPEWSPVLDAGKQDADSIYRGA